MKIKSQKHSPLKAKPLRNPGQSLDDQIHNLISEDPAPFIGCVLFMILVAIYDWYHWYNPKPINPWLTTITAFIFLTVFVYKWITLRRKIKRLRMARDGEKAVGQYLEGLREKGYKVLHDIVSDSFNIDHIVICTKGIFLIDTKTISKKDKDDQITFDGKTVLINGYKPDRDPVRQVTALSSWLKEKICEITGKEMFIRPVVAFPGWFVKMDLKYQTNVWVLSAKALPRFIEKQPDILESPMVHLITSHLTRYIRTL
jgi:hypothetical protein